MSTDEPINHASHSADAPFFVADMDEVRRRYREWTRQLPRVEPFYAVKCNPDPVLLGVLASMGVGFDCASENELRAVLALNVSADRIVYANPCKSPSHIQFAARARIRYVTFDNADELWKIRRLHPRAKLLLRISTDDSRSAVPLSKKFGAPMDAVPRLLVLARHLGLDVVGISFHVGCECYDPRAYITAVHQARQCFQWGEEAGYRFKVLDVGGGFSGIRRGRPRAASFAQTAMALNQALDRWFPSGCGVRIIAEPGRYFVERAYTLAVSVIARRIAKKKQRTADTSADTTANITLAVDYISDGIFGSFHIPFLDGAVPKPRVLRRGARYMFGDADVAELPTYASTVWGPTCDTTDLVHQELQLPELDIGDWLMYENMGAYTLAAASAL
ncbi:ornithine decarboxylase [Thamnocephalis sphaerospora]|uniref:ornithine decarboxylase n=1 Tax=Thamnocephalis sphaerospora TaxID=78915 RepID=A0A4P9XV02_9FUNG|nr:ornithine decarboxylase [Thamnocephalis sphaerospora]|eukprot:RKP10056.1 ornithine decarboxylase [Thamnocephalis sphaerospora]